VEQYPAYYFIVARMAETGERLGTEQLSLFLGKNYVLTFQERHGDCFEPVRDRIRKGGNKIRNTGPDYLAYAVLDAFIDNFFPFLEHLGERLETLEDEVILRPDTQTIAQIHRIKRDLLTMRRAVWPLRDALTSLIRESTPLITDDTRIYLRDCYDHTIRLIDLLETYREVATGLTDIYLSSLSNRLNEVMKVLTIFSAIFIPLSFIAGVYGMNFNPSSSPWNMPEVNWKWGYPFALALMAAVAIVLLIYFRRKGWLTSSAPPKPLVDAENENIEPHR
jgi:magnesium transporter